jgi:type II secretory ATPase GspE/PulE/Tfp pilus assembly ATPase PilB-like protein
MNSQTVITDITELASVVCNSEIPIVQYLQDRPSLHAIVTEQGGILYVNDNLRMLKQLLRLVTETLGAQPPIREITESVYQSFIQSHQPFKANGEQKREVNRNKKVEELLARAIDSGVSDIHLHAWQDTFIEGGSMSDNSGRHTTSSWIRFRKHQALVSAARISYEEAYALYRAAFTGEPYGCANIDDRRGNDASFQHPYRGHNYLVRLASVPDARGTSMTFRIRNAKDSVQLTDCGYSDQQLAVIQRFIKKNGGLLVVGGPTNSGKSTTLTAFLDAMDNKAILSYEDPVEVLLPEVSHIQLHRDAIDAEQTIRELMLQTMRMDPDVINVGELRDELMVSFAKEKASEGKLTTGTTHCGTIIMCFTRLLQLGISIEELAAPSTLMGVICQKLVPVTCPQCGLSAHPDPQQQQYYQTHLGGNLRYHNPEGCEHCDYTGISGQMLVSEVVELNRDIRNLIKQQDWDGIIEYFWEQQIDTLHVDALKKVQQGLLDPHIVEQRIDSFDSKNLRHYWQSQSITSIRAETLKAQPC